MSWARDDAKLERVRELMAEQGIDAIVARAPDGTIEAVELRDHPWLVAVQWHPEHPDRRKFEMPLFRALIAAASA